MTVNTINAQHQKIRNCILTSKTRLHIEICMNMMAQFSLNTVTMLQIAEQNGTSHSVDTLQKHFHELEFDLNEVLDITNQKLFLK